MAAGTRERTGSSLVQQAIERADDRDSAAQEIRALVDATFEVIAATGSLDPQIRPVLETSGLSRQAFYRHFESKDELMLLVMEESRQIVAAYVTKRMARVEGAAARLRAWIDGVMRQAQNPDAARKTRPFVVMGHRLQAQFPDAHERSQAILLQPLAEVIEEGVHAGVFESARPEADARIIYDAVFSRQNRHISVGTHPTRSEVDDLFAFALRALRPTV